MDKIEFRTGTFYLGDCFEVMPRLAPGSVDMVLNDPPYGTTACAWDAVIPFPEMWAQVRRVLKPTGAAVFTAAQPFASALVMSNPRDFRYDWVWEKGNASGFLNAKRAPLRAHEHVLVFGEKIETYFPQMTIGHPRKSASKKYGSNCCEVYGKQSGVGIYDSTDRYPRSVQFFSSDKQKGAWHPTQKPVALMEYLVRTYTDTGETVLDFTAGSGTTAVAATQSGRRWICIEKDPEYFAKAVARVLDAEMGG